MSDRVTWETCPVCGDPAALGWELLEGPDGAPVGGILVEFDCPNGCLVSEFMPLASVGTPTE